MTCLRVGIFDFRHYADKTAFENAPDGVEYKKLELEHVLPAMKRKGFKTWMSLRNEDLRNFFIMRVIKFRQQDSVDMLHCCNSVSVNEKPWVSSFEDIYAILAGDVGPPELTRSAIIKDKIQSKWCKALLPWSEHAKKTAEIFITEPAIREKLRVVYPAVRISSGIDVVKESGCIRFLFVGSIYNNNFNRKGGPELLRAFISLNNKYPKTSLTIIGKSDTGLIEKIRYRRNNIYFLERLEHKKISAEMLRHHVYVMPSKYDSFGYSVLEAMSFGLPLITTNHSALPEMVANGVNGFLLEAKFKPYAASYPDEWRLNAKYNTCDRLFSESIEKDLLLKMSMFAENPHLIKSMGEESLRIAKEKFSFEKRKGALKKIYEECIG